MNNLKQMGLALHNYHDAMSVFPPGYIAASKYIDGETDVAPGWSWASMILPQLDQSPLYSSINFSLPVQAPANTTATQTSLNVFLCPSDQIPGPTFAVTDGFGNTVATVAPARTRTAPAVTPRTSRLGLNNDGLGNGLFFRNSTIRIAADHRRDQPNRSCCWNGLGETRKGPGSARSSGVTSLRAVQPMPRLVRLRHTWPRPGPGPLPYD